MLLYNLYKTMYISCLILIIFVKIICKIIYKNYVLMLQFKEHTINVDIQSTFYL